MALDAKKYLKRVEKIDFMIQNKISELKQWKTIALSVTGRADGQRVQSSGSNQKMANAVEKCIDIENEINLLIDKLYNEKQEVIGTIEKLNATEYDLLYKVYIQHRSLQEVSDEFGKTYTWVTTVHGRALKNVQEIIEKKGWKRTIPYSQVKKRGCEYCTDMVIISKKQTYIIRGCIHSECPYHELDNFKSYNEYLKKAELNVGSLKKIIFF